jgi:hypothetical protein
VSRDDENLVGTQDKVRKTTPEEGRVDGRMNAKGTTEEAFGDDVDDVGAPGSIATKSQRASRKANTVATLVFSANRRISRWVHARRLEAERKEARLAQSLEASLGCDPDEADDAERGGGGSLVALDEDEEKKMRAGDLRSLDRRRRWVEFKELCREIAEHPRFNTFFLFLICLNTATMAVEHHGMDDDLAFFLVVANACFTAFFFLEVSVKLVGLGAWHFFSDAFNRFDFLIVSLAVVETVAVAVYGGYDNGGQESGGHDGGDGDDSNIVSAMRGLKVLRTFRVFKMFRYLSSLRVIGEVLLSSLSSFMSIAALLCLFTIVFSIVGLHVFGGMNTDPESQFKYGVDDPQLGGRAGFDTFYHSALTVFQVLTLEDWEFIMFKSVAYAGWSACFFFVSWVIVGKYTFLTLFLAVTMEAFESKYDAHAGEEARAVAELVRKKRARRRKRFAELRRRKKEKEKKLKALKAAEERKEEGGHKEDGSSERAKRARQKRRGDRGLSESRRRRGSLRRRRRGRKLFRVGFGFGSGFEAERRRRTDTRVDTERFRVPLVAVQRELHPRWRVHRVRQVLRAFAFGVRLRLDHALGAVERLGDSLSSLARRAGRPGVGGGLGAAERFSIRGFELVDDARAQKREKQRLFNPSQQSERPRGVVVFLRPAASQVARVRVRRRETPSL